MTYLGRTGLNQLMHVFVNLEPVTALVIKYVFIAIGIVFIVIHKNFVFGKVRVSTLSFFLLRLLADGGI
jgi:hypothetical protein